MEFLAVPHANWKPIEKAERGMGDVLLRVGAGSLDPAFIGHQDPESGRWFDQENREVQPLWFCPIPSFDGLDMFRLDTDQAGCRPFQNLFVTLIVARFHLALGLPGCNGYVLLDLRA